MTRHAFDAAKADFDEVAAAVAAFEGEGVTFDALASYEQDRAELLLTTPAPTLADVLVKLHAWRSIEAGDTRDVIDLIAADVERLLAEGAKQ
ncbi:MAG: hypothetical protein KJS97_01660 [Alphaproteobacteria bacterium]|nr:hypothetical protein [Alphaproteobacteria bacterium]